MFTAYLDTCTLVPIALSDTLLRVAEKGGFRPAWSERILRSVRRVVLEVHPDIRPDRIDKRLDNMREFFPDAMTTGWESLVDGIRLPDPNDRHVVAGAIVARADMIVTANIKDFPAAELDRFDLHAKTPDDFLLDLMDLDPDKMVETITEQAGAALNPPLTAEDVLIALGRAGAPEFARVVREQLPD